MKKIARSFFLWINFNENRSELRSIRIMTSLIDPKLTEALILTMILTERSLFFTHLLSQRKEKGLRDRNDK